jgi:flagellar basal-body rod modification protein FlgD
MAVYFPTSPTTRATSAADYTGNGELSAPPVKSLGQDQFLQLLVTKLKSQDPLNPEKDTDFLAQMAQFTSLEQVKGMQEQLTGMRSEQAISQSNGLLGRNVELELNGKTVSGVVKAVRIVDGVPKIEVSGQLFDLSAVRSVTTVK